MKFFFTIAIIAISILAFSQNNLSIFGIHHPEFNSLGNYDYRMVLEGLPTTSINPNMSKGNEIRLQNHEQQSEVQLYDSIYIWRWDILLPGWKLNNRTVDIIYDINNNLISNLVQNWNGSAWVNSMKSKFIFDDNNNMTSFIYQNWDGSEWVDSSIGKSQYDANNNRTSITIQVWINNAWVNLVMVTNTYDANNNMTSNLSQKWVSNAWVTTLHEISTFDANNNRTSYSYFSGGAYTYLYNNTYSSANNIITSIESIRDGSAWRILSQSNYTYDVNNNCINITLQQRDNTIWRNLRQYIWTYNPNNYMTSYTSQNWDGNAWVNSSLYYYTYITFDNQRSQITQFWDGTSWKNTTRETSIYDANNNLTSFLQEIWDGNAWINSNANDQIFGTDNSLMSQSKRQWNSTGTMLAGDSTNFYNHNSINDINDFLLRNKNSTIYLNPNSGKFTISSNITISAIDIYNLNGDRIYSHINSKQQNSKDFDLSKSPKGIYFVKINNGTKSYTQKVVIQ